MLCTINSDHAIRCCKHTCRSHDPAASQQQSQGLRSHKVTGPAQSHGHRTIKVTVITVNIKVTKSNRHWTGTGTVTGPAQSHGLRRIKIRATAPSKSHGHTVKGSSESQSQHHGRHTVTRSVDLHSHKVTASSHSQGHRSCTAAHNWDKGGCIEYGQGCDGDIMPGGVI